MKLFLDTEFNGFGGELISMALVAEDGRQWYRVRTIPKKPHPFVKANVLPHLHEKPIGPAAFTESLFEFLADYPGCEIIADWPADFEHLSVEMAMHGAGLGFRIPIECCMRLVISPELHPEVPHNALSDARALRDWYMARP